VLATSSRSGESVYRVEEIAAFGIQFLNRSLKRPDFIERGVQVRTLHRV
jgi:hypothetical protein